MNATVVFFLYLLFAVICTSAAILACRTPGAAQRLADGFRWLCAALAVAGVVGVATVSLPASPLADPARSMLRIVGHLGWLVVGTAVSAALLAAIRRGAAATIRFTTSSALIVGLSLYVAFAFFGFEIGKAAHDAEMRQFFASSGYPIWFMYAVMAAEIVGALALLVPRTRFIAACWLGAVMVGAIGTHARNGDPFSDSLDALRILILVGCIAILESKRGAAARTV